MAILSIFWESFAQALSQLWSNKLRTFLSLLGISIGIWCIVSVQASIDSLEFEIRNSFDKLGSDVTYLQKHSWEEDPHANYLKIKRRPNPSFKDFESIQDKAKLADAVAYSNFLGFKTIKFQSSSVEGAFLMDISYDYSEIFDIAVERGRYFSVPEYQFGSDKIIMGYNVSEQLFGNIDPVGRDIKMGGRKYQVIGILAKAGEGIFNPINFDNGVLIMHTTAAKFSNTRANSLFGSAMVSIKAKPDIPGDDMNEELRGILRASRQIKPKEDDNFALNSISIISNLLDEVFPVINQAGFLIGGFAIFVGCFSVANIMFVSVRERTSLIGVKKALGAKKIIILLEFLIEAITLCIIGGLMGLLLVQFFAFLVSFTGSFEIFLSPYNIFIGLIISFLTGIISGFIPAFMAANLDPVEAIRS